MRGSRDTFKPSGQWLGGVKLSPKGGAKHSMSSCEVKVRKHFGSGFGIFLRPLAVLAVLGFFSAAFLASRCANPPLSFPLSPVLAPCGLDARALRPDAQIAWKHRFQNSAAEKHK